MVADALEEKKMRMSDLDIILWSDRGAGRAQLVVYRRRRAQLNFRFTSDTMSSDGEKVSGVPFVELLQILSRHP